MSFYLHLINVNVPILDTGQKNIKKIFFAKNNYIHFLYSYKEQSIEISHFY